MLFRYPVAIEIGNEKTAYGVVVPDLPGVFSAGDTLEDALANAEEAILFALEDIVESGADIPPPTELEWMMLGKGGKGGPKRFPPSRWGWFVVNVDTGKLTAKAVRLNITLPEPLLKAIDKRVSAIGGTRSGYLAALAQRDLNKHRAA
ncbi:MAG: hypothetical protein BGP10_01180 [Rhodanobacter sp. 68-29]|nr:type II toxin-antitoxin system HicB family antitoxin [Rhodanobacter sp.]ODU75209.1 MAG: hypothetical protein ABT17_04530 [Rhodanobacter sp. SCN 69-32]OJY59582.1 MAG: hypothetical protein BGP10_01180 [Rhodanobacter sp. 68-29]